MSPVSRSVLLAAALASACPAANLAVSTYFRDGFTPTAIASDPAGNIYVAGFFVHGVGALQLGFPPPQQLLSRRPSALAPPPLALPL
jgi:hypothetical protein